MSKVVLITGCSKGGIGYELCLAFHSKGYKVFATARNLDKLDGLPEDVGKVQMDVTDESSVETSVKVPPRW
jgi:1-acylglycerone phosphate reductase